MKEWKCFNRVSYAPVFSIRHSNKNVKKKNKIQQSPGTMEICLQTYLTRKLWELEKISAILYGEEKKIVWLYIERKIFYFITHSHTYTCTREIHLGFQNFSFFIFFSFYFILFLRFFFFICRTIEIRML